LVISVSTSIGVAPSYFVITVTNGSSIFGMSDTPIPK
jgi:hypothetical protein